jgi:hypothetical protein
MQSQLAPANIGKIALRNGVSIGIFLGVIHSVITIISVLESAGDPSSRLTASSVLLYLLTPLIWIVGLLVAGIWTGKLTGKVGAGTMAGLFGGLFGGIVAGIGQAIASSLSVSPAPYYSASMILLSGYAMIFYILVLAIGAGAGCGALGGLIGQSISDVRQQVKSQPHPIATPMVPVYQSPAVPYGYMPQTPQPIHHTPEVRYQEQVIRQPEQ